MHCLPRVLCLVNSWFLWEEPKKVEGSLVAHKFCKQSLITANCNISLRRRIKEEEDIQTAFSFCKLAAL